MRFGLILVVNKSLMIDPTIQQPGGLDLPHHVWCVLNHTGQARCVCCKSTLMWPHILWQLWMLDGPDNVTIIVNKCPGD